MIDRKELTTASRVVVKVGSALLTADGKGLDEQFIGSLAAQIAALRERDIEVVLVSSGSIVAGLAALGISQRPTKINLLQAAAAVGQAALIRAYDDAFTPLKVQSAQVLLTHADIANRTRYLNARATLTSLLSLGILSIVNENDTVATEEICFGDNDSLGGLVANLIDADAFIILTDQEGLFTADPRSDPSATLLSAVSVEDPTILSMATSGSRWGRGGMVTKLQAAKVAARSGAATVIASGRQPNVLIRLVSGEDIGTFLIPSERVSSKKQWMANQMRITGKYVLDAGAVQVVSESGRSLLPVGITAVEGDFERGSLVSLCDPEGREIGRGLSNYDSLAATKIKGLSSAAVRDLLGDFADTEVVHRDHLVVF